MVKYLVITNKNHSIFHPVSNCQRLVLDTPPYNHKILQTTENTILAPMSNALMSNAPMRR